MNCATKTRHTQRLIWISWLIVFLVALLSPAMEGVDGTSAVLLGVTQKHS